MLNLLSASGGLRAHSAKHLLASIREDLVISTKNHGANVDFWCGIPSLCGYGFVHDRRCYASKSL
jgi:hypothetical protein